MELLGDTLDADTYGPRQFGMQSVLLRRESLEANDDCTIRDLRGVLTYLDTYASSPQPQIRGVSVTKHKRFLPGLLTRR